VTVNQGAAVHSTYNKNKDGSLDWSHLVYELPSKTRYGKKEYKEG